ncbi:MAG: hypothetical protein FJ088_02330, partial [Deltaproteobacteria bacterium]|nr:hypothetical protein [Deltaproteobacteria bacterium]
MSKRIALVFSFFVTAAVHGFASGDVPGEIAFQGFLTDSEGAPVNGNMEMGFDLFDSDSGGESLGWSENQEVSVSDGLFNLFLGAVNPINPLIFDGKSLYLEVKVNGEVMDSRLEIASTAYCFTAQTALNVPTAEDIKVVCYDEENELVAVLDDNYAPLVHDHSTLYYSKSENDTKLAGKSDAGHQHDDLYYQKGYIDGQFVLKSDVGHAHDDLYYGKTYMDNALSEKSNTGHNHDDIYFTETETTTFLNGKADMVHAHDASDIASGTLADGRLSTNVSLLGQMIESAEIGDGEILFEHLNQNLCLDGQVIKWSDENNAWECGNDETASGGSGGVTSVTASAPLSVANGTTTPHIALDKAAVQGWAQETCFDVEGELTALLDNNYASTTHNHDLLYALIGHDHNAAYYLKGDVDAKLAVKSDLGHLHDDLYYQKSYVDAALSGKSDTGHNHDSTYVNAGEFGSVTSAMVTNETLLFEDIGANGCGANQVMKRKSDNSGWECANDSMRTQTEVENWAKGVCYDGEGELTALLNDNYAAAAHTHVAADITSGTLDNARLSSSVSLLGQGIDSNEITDGTIMNNDVASNAAILYGKLNLFGSITNSDVSTTAGIGYGKLNLFSSIVDSDISGAANISDTKLATISTAGKVADSALSSNVSKFGSSVNLDSSETTGVLPVAKGGTGSSTPNFVDLSTNQTVAGNKIFSGSATFDNTITGNVSGNAGTVTNGVYTTGGYSDPVWITSLAGSKISGNISGNAANVTGVVAVANGGTGFSVPGPSGNLLRSNGVGWESWTPNFLTSEVDGVIGNEVTNAANSTLTRSGTGTSGNPYTLALNLNNANSWGAVQTFSAGANISGTLTVLGSLSLPVSGITGAGSGSGLDADKLDGQHANAFAAADHNHDTLYASIAPHQVPGTNVITTIAGDASP